MKVQACFDRLEICVNQALKDLMEEHLLMREQNAAEDTPFDRWIHQQIYKSDYSIA
jgi:hypothetical protein